MNDRELDEKLKIAYEESEKFFNNFVFKDSPNTIKKKMEQRNNIRMKTFIPINFKQVAIFFTILLLFAASYSFFLKEDDNLGIPVLQQRLDSDSKNNEYLINYFSLTNPNYDKNMLVILWQKKLGEKYKVLYSSIMEDTNRPTPVTIINIPDSQSKLALGATRNEDKDFIHYRLLKYNHDTVDIYLEENYVVNGKVHVDNGILVEERVIPADYYIINPRDEDIIKDKIYRYIVPIELRNNGGITLTTSQVKLKQGGILTIIPDDKMTPLEFDYNPDIFNRIWGFPEDSFINFEIKGKGYSNIRIKRKDINESKNLFINIVD